MRVYMEYLQGIQQKNNEEVLVEVEDDEDSEETAMTVTSIIAENYVDVKELRQRLVTIAGYDMTDG